MIVVTGATGQLGCLIVAELLASMSADQVGVSVRDLSKANDLAARGVRVRRGDLGASASLADAFEGAKRLLALDCPGRPLTSCSGCSAPAVPMSLKPSIPHWQCC